LVEARAPELSRPLLAPRFTQPYASSKPEAARRRNVRRLSTNLPAAMSDSRHDGKSEAQERLRRALLLLFSALLLVALHAVLRPFLVPIGWATVLTLAGWPLYRRLLHAMPRWPGLASLIMVLLIFVLIIGPAGAVGTALVKEARSAVQATQQWLQQPDAKLPEWVVKLPQVGPKAQELFESRFKEEEARKFVVDAQQLAGRALPVLGDVVGFFFRTVAHLVICLFAAFFLFRYGARVAVQVQRVAIRIGGSRFEALLRAVRATVKGAVYGTVVTAIAQAVLAGVGFYFAQTPVPLLFGLATFVVAFIPFGPPLIYLPLAAVIVANGAPWWHGLLLALWGVGVISSADNFLRPLFISQATSLPLLLVFFGVLGGVAAFGLIGVFIGPAVIAVAHVLWNEWAQPEIPPTTAEMRIVEVD
ncbi:MAG TPA: AI-2E family transporter, partial [Planctomycetota bacterium]|nr:AI-2E family transporter [Planctomycetota bacterium]